MKRQTIYPLLIVTLAMILVTHAHAQTRQDDVSEARIRKLVSPDEEAGTALQFAPVSINRALIQSANLKQVTSPSSPQELRALIFQNYTPPGAKGVALRSAAAPKQSSGAGADKLPSETAAAEANAAKQTVAPVNTPPTQGDVKEEQQ